MQIFYLQKISKTTCFLKHKLSLLLPVSKWPMIRINFVFRICPSTLLCFTILASDAYYLVYLLFDTVIQYLFMKWYLNLSWKVLNHVWFMFNIMNKWTWEDVDGTKKLYCKTIVFSVMLRIFLTHNESDYEQLQN